MMMFVLNGTAVEAVTDIEIELYAIDPVPITGGPYAGKFAVAASLADDPRYRAFSAALRSNEVVDLNLSEAFPENPDGEPIR